MSSHDSTVDSSDISSGRSLQAGGQTRLAGAWSACRDRLECLGLELWLRAKSLHPLTTYRIIALAIAIGITASNLHRDSTVVDDARFLVLAAVHAGLTLALAPRLTRRSDTVNVAVIVIDIAICVLLITDAHGWRGPLWLYSVSAVFWPAWRFSLRGALLSVTVFDALVLLLNRERLNETVSSGFGGDVIAQLLMVYLVAGAISLTSQAFATVRLMATENERNRIARDLHDGVGKTMGGISMEARTLAHWIERDPDEANRRARYVARISEKAAIEVRDVIRGLRKSEATEELFPDVRLVVDEWSLAHPKMQTTLQLNGHDTPMPVLIHGEILRMLSELLCNVERHANAQRVWIRVTRSSSAVTLAVRDDGVGFDINTLDPWSGEGHFGLLGASERASMLAGHFAVSSTPATGTQVTIDLPLTPREDRAVHVVR